MNRIELYIRKIRSFFLTKKINKNIADYKYIHIMNNDKFVKPFVDFLNKNFNPDEHMVLCYRTCPDKAPTLFPRGRNVYEYVYFKDITGLLGDNIDKIIFHSLFLPGVIDRLYREPELLKKSYWVIWGGDLYNAPRDEKNDFVRKNFKGYISLITGDEKVAQNKYNSNSVLMNAMYIPLTKIEHIKGLNKNKKSNITIQINNSCNESTLEMLDILSKFKDKNIKIRTILSYGKMEYKDKIIQKGKEIFGDKFEYLDKYISADKYAKYIADNDILILNPNRQQGAGNIMLALSVGVKVFVCDATVSSKFFKDEGFIIYDSANIKNLTFEELLEYPEEPKNKNIEKAYLFLSDSQYMHQFNAWTKVFEYKD